MGKIVNEIKNLVIDRDMTLKQLAEMIGKKQNKNYSLASLSQKLRNETISYKEIKLIAELLDYKIKFSQVQFTESTQQQLLSLILSVIRKLQRIIVFFFIRAKKMYNFLQNIFVFARNPHLISLN